MKNAKQLAQCSILTALALVLSYMERFFPLQALIPLPGIKLGLANIVTLVALELLGGRSAVLILAVRCGLGAVFGGGVTGLLFSLSGGLLAMAVMLAARRVSFFSIYGVSILGAAAHSVGQIGAAMALMQSVYVGAYLPWLLLTALPCGLATACAAAGVLRVLRKQRWDLNVPGEGDGAETGKVSGTGGSAGNGKAPGAGGTAAWMLAGCLILGCTTLTGCGAFSGGGMLTGGADGAAAENDGMRGASNWEQYQAVYYDLFDTVTTITGRAESEETFKQQAQGIYEELLDYHQLFDIYNEYEGIPNLKTVNDSAGKAPVAVDERIIALLQDCLDYYEKTDGRVNIAMGGVLALWHEARTAAWESPELAALPDGAALAAAGEHMDPVGILIDSDASSVYLADEKMLLDVGAVAKGWAVQRAAENAPEGFLISVGGNVCVTGPKDDKGTPWTVGLQDPEDPEKLLCALSVEKGCVVTSGDYQRTYEVDGKSYHHIIDPDTLYPAERWRSVTVVCGDSGAADALSTALFLMDQQKGQALLTEYGAEAMWVDADGKRYYSEGFAAMIRR